MASIIQRGKRWRAELCVNRVRQSKSFPTRALAEAWAEQTERRIDSMPAARKAIEDHRISAALPVRLKEAIALANYSESEIVSSQFHMPEGPCVYFLILGDSVRYVGQTEDLPYRLHRHRKSGKRFDSYAVVVCERDQLDRLEATYINLLLPPDNKRLED